MESPLALYQPAFCFVVQGGKQVLVGDEVLRYDPGHYLLFTVDLPVVFRVGEASEAKPYFGLRLDLDPALVASVMMEAGAENQKGDASIKAIGIVADPNFAPMYATRDKKIKTDKRDARALCEACRLGAYRPAHRTSEVSARSERNS
jgi:AraC-type transcriptional regulator N-terminus